MITVSQLIEFLKTQPQSTPVVFCQFSDYTELELNQIHVKKLQMARGDGYVGSERPDRVTIDWLVFPGN